MKTFLPVISPSGNVWHTMALSLASLDNKRLGKQRVESYQIWRTITGLNKTKSWRTSPCIHMWRAYPEALGVYIDINCKLWALRTSEATGKPFSNERMDQHIETYAFGKKPDGTRVYITDEEKQHQLKQQQQQQEASSSDDEGESDDTVIPPSVDPAVAAAADAAVAAASNPSTVAAAVAAHASPATRPGTYVDGIRIPWWFHDRRIHDSDAAILYSKDKKYYSAFKKYANEYKEYVWPRDLVPFHADQQPELNELQAVLDAEEAEKLRKQAEKKEKKAKEREDKKKRKREEKENEGEEAEEEEEATMDADSMDTSVDSAAAQPLGEVDTNRMVDVDAPIQTPKKARRSRKSPTKVASPVSPDDAATVPAMSDLLEQVTTTSLTKTTYSTPIRTKATIESEKTDVSSKKQQSGAKRRKLEERFDESTKAQTQPMRQSLRRAVKA